MAAFERARNVGARAVELDVRTCAGGDAVVFHDATLERMTGSRDRRPVSEVPRSELGQLDLGGGARVPSLAEVLAWARACQVAVNVELKHDVPSRLGLARAAVAAFQAQPADVLWSSFDPLLLAIVAVLFPVSRRAMLVESGGSAWADRLDWLGYRPFVTAVHSDARRPRERAARYAKRGLRWGVWTVNDPQEAKDLVALGARTVITDAPDRVLAALERSSTPTDR
jgi:glycerophosphoryl diester phosphodiesterase